MHCRSKVSLLLCLLLSATSYARVFVVTDSTDNTGIHSLRGAVIAANRLGGRNAILLRGTVHLTIQGANEDQAETGDLNITRGDLTILGSSSNATIDASEMGDRVFRISKGAELTLSKLIITGGRAPGSDFDSILGLGNGGAINNAGILNLLDCTFTNNTSGPGTDNMGNGAGNDAGKGGALYNSGRLVAVNCLFERNFTGDGFNSSSGGDGGAIANDGVCKLSLCSITDNRTGNGASGDGYELGLGGPGGNGGGIFNFGTMSLKNCSVRDNSCGLGAVGTQATLAIITFPPAPPTIGDSGSGGSGGGIYNLSQLQIDDCAIFFNVAGDGAVSGGGSGRAGFGGNGGGIFNQGILVLNTSTLTVNYSGAAGGAGANGADGGSGGGIYNGGSLNLTSCTITLNQAGPNRYGGQGGSGGGIFNAGTDISTTRNTLIALNTVSSEGEPGIGPDVGGNFVSGGFNLVGIADGGAGFTNGSNADLAGSILLPIDPLIGPLQMNGGPTPTQALLPGSPAIDQGNCFKIQKDQRGVRRHFDDPAIPNATGGDGSDIGAFEVSSKQRH